MRWTACWHEGFRGALPPGAALDLIADKVLITVAFICFASTGLVPWYLALVVIGRDRHRPAQPAITG